MMETVRTTVHAAWNGFGHTYQSADIVWLNEHLTNPHGETLDRPWPLPDPAGIQQRWQGYSTETATLTTTEILAEAVAGYRDLVEKNLPAFGPALGLYSILPVRIEGTITYHETHDYYPPELDFAWIPDPDSNPNAPIRVELRSETWPSQNPLWFASHGPRPESRAAYHLPTIESEISPLGSTRPSTNLAYKWLARDLHALGWLKQPITFHE